MFPWNNNFIWAITDVGEFDFVFLQIALETLESIMQSRYLFGRSQAHVIWDFKANNVGKVKCTVHLTFPTLFALCTWPFKRFMFLLFSQKKKKKKYQMIYLTQFFSKFLLQKEQHFPIWLCKTVITIFHKIFSVQIYKLSFYFDFYSSKIGSFCFTRMIPFDIFPKCLVNRSTL